MNNASPTLHLAAPSRGRAWPVGAAGWVLALGLSTALSVALATTASWDEGLLLLAGAALIGLYFWRPVAAIAVLLLPFVLFDERTPDALPLLNGLTGSVFGYGSVLCVGAAALIAHLRYSPHPDQRRATAVSATAVLLVVSSSVFLALLLGLYPAGATARAAIPFLNALGAAYVAWRLVRHWALAEAEAAIAVGALAVGTVLSSIGVLRVTGLLDSTRIAAVPLTFYDSASAYVLLICAGSAGLAASRAQAGRMRIALVLASSAFLAVAVGSQRRGVLVGFALALIVALFVAVASRQMRFSRLVVSSAVGLVVGLAVLSGLGQVVPGGSEVLEARLSSSLQGFGAQTTDNSVNYRFQESQTVSSLIGRTLIVGIGPETPYQSVDAQYVPDGGVYIHNTYLMLPLRYGVLGVLAGALLVVGLIVVALTHLWQGPPLQAWILGVSLLALIPAIATAAFLTHTFRWPVIVGVVAGLFDGLASKTSTTPSEAASTLTADRARRNPRGAWEQPEGPTSAGNRVDLRDSAARNRPPAPWGNPSDAGSSSAAPNTPASSPPEGSLRPPISLRPPARVGRAALRVALIVLSRRSRDAEKKSRPGRHP